ncbi:hypothetical protein B7494_g6643 [Chlorociboria aeruginascens]|nr:hypothetical protein B7494_g6643 [Chlorociboria aeruginascens]
MNFSTAAFLVLTAAIKAVNALSAAEWRSQSIYQVFTDRFARTDGSTTAACDTTSQIYCGGSWQGITNKLDYIQGMGFTAIWISPIVTNLVGNTADGEAYHGYWAQDISSLNSNFGTTSDLTALSTAVHARGMYLMVDMVTNHMGYDGCGTCVDYSIFTPFNSQSDYHPFCLIDYSNTTSIEYCWEGDNNVSLPDLRTEDSDIQDTWNSWVTSLVSTYSIDGIRLDSAQQVGNAFLPSFQSAAGVYIVGEVDNGDPTYVCPYQNYVSGLLNYPAFYWITQAFESTSGSISNLVNGINAMKSDCADTTLLGSFLENHDNPRFPSLTSDISLTKNAIAFTILADGIPITSVNQIRNQAIYKDSSYVLYKTYPIYSDSSTIVMRKGDTGYQIISVFSNLGASGSSYTLTLSSSETGFTASQSLVEVTGCTSYTTDSNGNLNVAMAGGLPLIFYPLAQLTGRSSGSTTSKILTSATVSSCTTPTSVAVTFDELATTTYGETIKLSGSIAALGKWDTTSAITLSASQYTSSNPLWFVTLGLAPGTVLQYKYINVANSGAVTWEADPNHTYTVPASCATTAATVSNSWQSE